MFVIVAFLLYHFMGGCSCGMLRRDGFSVGGTFYCGQTSWYAGSKKGCQWLDHDSKIDPREYFGCHIGSKEDPCLTLEPKYINKGYKKDDTFKDKCTFGTGVARCIRQWESEPEPAYDCTMEVDKCSNAWVVGEQRYKCNAYVNNSGNQCEYNINLDECSDSKSHCPKPAPAPGPPEPIPGDNCTYEIDDCGDAWLSKGTRYSCNAYKNNLGNQCIFDDIIKQCRDTGTPCPKPVFCDPKSNIPQICPNGIPCPQCGEKACPCPKN
jgi:hypothetical protein